MGKKWEKNMGLHWLFGVSNLPEKKKREANGKKWIYQRDEPKDKKRQIFARVCEKRFRWLNRTHTHSHTHTNKYISTIWIEFISCIEKKPRQLT